MEGDVCPQNEVSPSETCSENLCFINNETDKDITLTCNTCSRKVHYKCARLPLYQLQRFRTFGKTHKFYICCNCVDIPPYLRTILTEEESEGEDHTEVNYEQKFKDELKALKETICNKDNEIQTLKERLSKLEETNIIKKCQKKRKITNDGGAIEEDSSKLSEDLAAKKDLAMKDEQIKMLNKQNSNLNERLVERENPLDETLQKLAETENLVGKKGNTPLIEEINNIYQQTNRLNAK